MLSLVDQLLLFRKSESGLDTVQPSKLNFYSLAWEVYLCFVQQAKSKNISYSFECEDRDLEIYADREKLEIILFNLLSNAIKYTSEKGTVKLLIRSLQDIVEVEIIDTGAGIPKNVGDRLFEKFYKPHRTLTGGEAGFGIGLYLVKHFTEQHNGVVSYESEEGKGSVFKLRLLKGNSHFGKIEEIKAPSRPVFIEELSEEPLDDNNNRMVSKEVQEVVSEKQTILIIDDDEQIRHYLNDLFKDQYLIKEAENGEKGLKQAQKNLPDLIISDVHMPGLDGIDLCKAIKENDSLSHIPVILLTASASEIMKLRGVEGGADDYIVKPFDNTLLKARVANLLKRKNALQKYFYNEITLNKTEVKISGEYKEFIEKCIQIVENHLEDESFGVKTLLSEMGMSHSNLFRKVKSVSGQSVNVFIRYIRLRKAAEFFINTNYNVNETAFMVGINDLKYFREQFNKLFGMNPSGYIRKYRRLHGKQFTIDRESIDPENLSTDPNLNS
jgi:DNA-binding response OmpR family regulator/anti-sigma regulatory factor (Ser/Thr protein kinase)